MKLHDDDPGSHKEVVTLMLFEILDRHPIEPSELRRRICRAFDLRPHGGTETDSHWWNTLRQGARDLGNFLDRPSGVGGKGEWRLTQDGLRLKRRILDRDESLDSPWSSSPWIRSDTIDALEARRKGLGKGPLPRRPRRPSILDSPRLARVTGKK